MIDWPHLLWACGETAHHGEIVWWSETTHLTEQRAGLLIPVKGMPSGTYRPLTRPHLLKFPAFPNSAKPGAYPLKPGPSGDILDLRYSIKLELYLG